MIKAPASDHSRRLRQRQDAFFTGMKNFVPSSGEMHEQIGRMTKSLLPEKNRLWGGTADAGYLPNVI
jgi:hypothetical protein